MNFKSKLTLFLVAVLVTNILLYSTYSWSQKSPKPNQYNAQKGDTLYLIGQRFGVPWEDIALLNSIQYPYAIRSGQVLNIPTVNSGCQRLGVSLKGNQTYGQGSYANYKPTGSKLVMLRFDDAHQNQWVNALPILEKYGYKAVFAVVIDRLIKIPLCGDTGGSLSWGEVQWLKQQGNEISDHTYSHAHLNNQSLAGLHLQIVESKQKLMERGINPITLTLPYGEGYDNATVLNYIFSHGFKYVYAVEQPAFLEKPHGAIMNYLTVQSAWIGIDELDDQSLGHFQSIVSRANSTNVIGLTFHNVGDNIHLKTGYYINMTNFEEDMAYLNSAGYTVITPDLLPNW